MRFRVSAFEFVRRGFREKNKREKNRQKPTSRAPRLSHPVLVTVFFSRKMVNILNVDRHRQSVAWIKLCIIENVVRVFRAFGSGGRGRMGTPRAAVIVLRGAFGLSDELGYASGDGRHRITVDFARHSRHGKYNLQSRAVRVSSARESVHTRASAGMMKKKNLETEPPTPRRAPRSAKPSDGMLNWRHGRTRGLPDNYSGPSRDVSSQA
jgi:hypothetical protein